MKTAAEMKANYQEKLDRQNAAIEKRVAEITATWIAFLESNIESAFNSINPVDSVSVRSNQFTVGSTMRPFQDVVKLAAERVRTHFISQPGYNSTTFESAYEWISVEVFWA